MNANNSKQTATGTEAKVAPHHTNVELPLNEAILDGVVGGGAAMPEVVTQEPDVIYWERKGGAAVPERRDGAAMPERR